MTAEQSADGREGVKKINIHISRHLKLTAVQLAFKECSHQLSWYNKIFPWFM